MKISLNSSTKVTSYVDPARIKYLWSKARQAVRSYIIFKRMGSDIRTFGTTQKTEFKINTPKSFAIHPRSLAKRTFNTLILILLALDSIFLPYYLCFFSESKQWKYMKLLENIIYAIDCILSFFTSYWHHEHTLITDKNIIIRNYLKTWFLLDIITLLPYQFLPSGYILLSLLCLLKYFKILSFSMRFLKFYKTSMNHLLLRLIETLFAVVIMVQVLSCLWFYISKLQGFPLDCWMVHFNLTDKSDFYIYLTCIYWVFTTITTVGFGDITPQSLTEKVFAMIVMAVGVSFYSLTVGNITKIISTMDHKKRLLDSKLNTLEILSKEYSLPSFIKDKIKDTVIQNSSENLSLYNETQLVFELPSSLRSEVSLHLYKSIIQKIKFFQLKDPSFLSFVVPKLTNMNCVPHKYIYRIDDEVYDMFFIKSGRILFKASNGVVFRSYVSGSYFGEIELLGNSTRINSAQVSASPSELLALSKKFLEVVFKDYPEIYNEINALASVRQKVNSEAMAHALKLEINYSDLEKNDSLMSSSDSLSQFISEPEEEAQASGHQTWLQRRDTGVMVANLTISPRKVQNITRWSNAVQQMPRSKTQINNTNALLLKERQKDMKRQASLRSRQKKYKLKKLKKCMKVYEKVKCIDIQENQSFYDHSDQKIIKHDFIVSGLLDEVSRIDNLMLNHAANSLNLIQKINFEQEECLINLETLKQLINSKRNSDYYTNIQLYTLNMTSQAYININHR